MTVLSGPRQSGKTTIAQQALQRINLPGRYVPCDALGRHEMSPHAVVAPRRTVVTSASGPEQLVRHWRTARTEAERHSRGFVLVLDEIQSLPDWSRTVKGLWDADRACDCPLRVVLLGSAPLAVQSGLTESLMGRFETLPVSHWTYEEMSQSFSFSLDEYLYYGAYPGPALFRMALDRWKYYVSRSIVSPVIDRDLLAMTRVDKPALLKRLFSSVSEYSGQIVSYTKLVGQLQDAGNTTTLARYLDLLELVGLAVGLSKYSGHRVRARRSVPKLNVLNTALMTGTSTYTFEEARADRTYWGRVVESAVGAHLYNSATPNVEVQYWSERDAEVDFVLSGGPNVVGIEVKSGKRGRSRRGITAFRKRCGVDNCLVVGPGGVPLDEFFRQPADHWVRGT